MSHISEEIKDQILEKSTLYNTLQDYHGLHKKSGVNYILDCPKCGSTKKLQFNEAKSIVKCFKCDLGASTGVNFLTKFHDLDFPQALKELARIESIDIPTQAKPKRSRSTAENKISFLHKMLDESGLTTEDITDLVRKDTDKDVETSIYQSGTVDKAFNIIYGDDVIIFYYDLEGRPMTYYKKNRSGQPTGNPLPFYRVRYQNPELHKDKNDKPVKYRSPFGSEAKLFINKTLRAKYKAASKITTLYVQEGEKKADKATKHGLISVGINGIHNIAYKNVLPKEFEQIIIRCQVERVVFVLDADWQDLSNKIDSTHTADNRPRSFARAVINFQKHFYAFTNNDIHLDIYFGHVNPNPENDKGIDDLLTNSLRGKEDELKKLCEKALVEPKGDATWLQFYNITTMGEYKILSKWHLTNIDDFVSNKPYREVLMKLPKFKFGKIEWKINKNGEKELAQPLMSDETFWNEVQKKDSTTYTFNHKRCYNFLQNRGYSRLDMGNNTFAWVKTESNVVHKVEAYQIKDYVIDFAGQLNQEEVENMLYRNGKNYLGPDSLGNLKYTQLNLHQPSKNIQYLYFNESFFKVTDTSITLEETKNLNGQVWKDAIKDFSPKLLPPFIESISQIDNSHIEENSDLKTYKGEYSIDFSDQAMECDFLRFLLNTSIFFGKKKSFEQASLAEKFETTRHLLSKITAFGYMLHRFRNPSCERAVIGMDGQMSEVGKSNGRSGKSLFGVALEQLVPTVSIPGKKRDLLDDKYLFEEVDQRTCVIFFDDVRVNFDFEFLFPSITGKLTIEKKGIGKTTLPREYVQKFYIATNHALSGEGGSFEDRQFLLGYSDWYNSNHKPVDDFEVMFFDEWDEKQWNLYYNFAALSLHLYLKHGLINAPNEKLINRKLRQEIGESFLDWADEYFSNSRNVNTRVYKNDMYDGSKGDSEHPIHGDGFVTKYPTQRKYTNITTFKHKLRLYCTYRGYEFNPSRKGEDIKTGGREYIEIFIPDEDLNKIKEAEGAADDEAGSGFVFPSNT